MFNKTIAVAGVLTGLTLTATACAEPAADANNDPEGELHQELPESIQDAGSITFGGHVGMPPYLYEEDGEVVGFEKDFMDALGRVLEVDIDFQDTAFDALIPGLESGRIDVAMGNFTDTLERQEVVDFVDYAASFQGLLVESGNPLGIETVDDLCGTVMAGVQGTLSLGLAETFSEDCVSADNEAIEILATQDANNAQLQVQTGRADAVMGDYALSAYLAETVDELDAAGEPMEEQVQGAALTKGNEELRDVLVKAFQELIDTGEYTEILSEYNVENLALDEAVVNAAQE